jgi:hypothetical protein
MGLTEEVHLQRGVDAAHGRVPGDPTGVVGDLGPGHLDALVPVDPVEQLLGAEQEMP